MVERFLTYIRAERRYSDTTATAYGRDIRRFMAYYKQDETNFDPAIVTTDDIREWIISLTGSGLSPTSVNRMTSSLRAFFRWARKVGIISGDPFLRIGFQRTPSKLPSFIPETKMAEVIEQSIDEGFEARRNALIITLFYATGIRLAELVGIRRSDFSAGYRELSVTGKGNKQRIVPLIEYARMRVTEYIAQIKAENICTLPDNFLFLTSGGAPLSRDEVYRIVRAELVRMGVQGKRSPHVLRHTFATHMLNEGADMREIQQMLGHASLAATQVYTHNSITQLKDAYRGAHPRGRPASVSELSTSRAHASEARDAEARMKVSDIFLSDKL